LSVFHFSWVKVENKHLETKDSVRMKTELDNNKIILLPRACQEKENERKMEMKEHLLFHGKLAYVERNAQI